MNVRIKVFLFICICLVASRDSPSLGTYYLATSNSSGGICCLPDPVIHSMSDMRSYLELYFSGSASCQTSRTDQYKETQMDFIETLGRSQIEYKYKSSEAIQDGIIFLDHSSEIIVENGNCTGIYTISYTTGWGLFRILFYLILLGCCVCCIGFCYYRCCRPKKLSDEVDRLVRRDEGEREMI